MSLKDKIHCQFLKKIRLEQLLKNSKDNRHLKKENSVRKTERFLMVTLFLDLNMLKSLYQIKTT